MILINNNNFRRPNLIQILAGLFLLFIFLYVGFYITKWILYGLAFLAPLLLILAAFLNFSTIRNFARYIWGLIRVKPVLGIALALLAIVGFPVTSALLFIRAWSQWRKRKNYVEMVTSDGSEYIDYEVIEDERTYRRRVDVLERRK